MSKKGKEFDAVAMMRSARDELSARIGGKSLEEESVRLASQEGTAPLFERSIG
jgi:hypothetical protein